MQSEGVEPPEYVRVDGRYVCDCGKQARDHAPSERWRDEAGDTLRELCDGRLVKT